MPISSYQQPNSYTELDFKPFKLDYSSMLKEVSAKTEYWMQGVSKLQQSYKSIVDLNPQIKANKDNLKSFTDELNKQVGKLSSSEIGVQGVANQIDEMSKPLYDPNNPVSENILYDDLMYKHGISVNKSIQDYKTKDKGIYYAQANEQYAMDSFNEYMKMAQDPNADPAKVKELYRNRREYTPYYDYNKEVKELLKDCKPDASASVNPGNKFYINTSKGLTPSRVNRCLDGLSSKAYDQMKIEGSVSYGKDYNQLQKDYLATSNQSLLNNQNSLQTLMAEKQSLERKTNRTVDEDNKLTSLATMITSYRNDITDTKEQINKVSDINFVSSNYEKLAGSLYTKSKLAQISTGRAYSEDGLEANVTELKLYDIENNWKQMLAENHHDIVMQSIKHRDAKEIAQMGIDADITKKMIEKGLVPGTPGGPGGAPIEVFNNINDKNIDASSFNEYDNAIRELDSEKSVLDYSFEAILKRTPEYKNVSENGAILYGQKVTESQWYKTQEDIVRNKLALNVSLEGDLETTIGNYITTSSDIMASKSILIYQQRELEKNVPESAKKELAAFNKLPDISTKTKTGSTISIPKSDIVTFLKSGKGRLTSEVTPGNTYPSGVVRYFYDGQELPNVHSQITKAKNILPTYLAYHDVDYKNMTSLRSKTMFDASAGNDKLEKIKSGEADPAQVAIFNRLEGLDGNITDVRILNTDYKGNITGRILGEDGQPYAKGKKVEIESTLNQISKSNSGAVYNVETGDFSMSTDIPKYNLLQDNPRYGALTASIYNTKELRSFKNLTDGEKLTIPIDGVGKTAKGYSINIIKNANLKGRIGYSINYPTKERKIVTTKTFYDIPNLILNLHSYLTY